MKTLSMLHQQPSIFLKVMRNAAPINPKAILYSCIIFQFQNLNCNMNQHLYFHLFANCIPVKGVNRSVICDLQQNSFEFIPNELFFILTKQSKKTVQEIKAYFDNAYDEIIDEYFDFLIQKKVGRWITKLDKGLTDLDLSYEVPNTITNCIIDFDKTSNHPLSKIVSELDELICQAVQLRF